MDLGALNLPGNPEPGFDPSDEAIQHDWAERSKELTEELHRVFLDGYMPSSYGQKDARVFRASSMGHPALEIAAKKFLKNQFVNCVDEKTMLTFWMGHSFEAWLSFLYTRAKNLDIVGVQHEHNWRGITGHSDFIIKDEHGNRFIADAKAINARAFNKYQRYGLLDDRGYATQLAIYSASFSNIPACIVMMNKENGKVDHVWLTEEMKERCLERAKFIKETIVRIDSSISDKGNSKFEACFAHFRPPIPRAEVYKKQYTGRILPPDNMVYSPLLELLYETYKDTNNRNEEKTYVSDYKYPEQYKQYKPDIEEDVYD